MFVNRPHHARRSGAVIVWAAVVGLGLGADLTLMDRMARQAGTGVKDPNNPNGPKTSRYASGNPADYQSRLTAIFDEIASTPSIQLVK
jgi:hypothetical protein